MTEGRNRPLQPGDASIMATYMETLFMVLEASTGASSFCRGPGIWKVVKHAVVLVARLNQRSCPAAVVNDASSICMFTYIMIIMSSL